MSSKGGFEQGRKFALITGDKELSKSLVEAAARISADSLAEISLKEVISNPMSLTGFDAVVLDVDDGSVLDGGALLISRQSWPEIPLVILSGELEQQRARTVVKLAAADWIGKPVSPREILNAVFTVSKSAPAASKVITFISASGGAGATFLALQTAVNIAGRSRSGADVAIVDLDFQKADVGGHVNLINEFDINGIIAEPERIDQELLETIQVKSKNGICIYSFSRPDVYLSEKGARFVFNLLDNISNKHSVTVVDLPNHETPWYASVLNNSDVVVIVFELNIPSIRHARTILRRIRKIRGRTDNVMFVASKIRRSLFSRNIRYRDVQKRVLDNQPIRTITRAQDVVEEALDRSVFLEDVPRSGKLSKDIGKLADEILKRISKS